MLASSKLTESSLLAEVEQLRLHATAELTDNERAAFGQFLTPPRLAETTADLFEDFSDSIHLLEPGAGVGALIAAATVRVLGLKRRPKTLRVTAYEIESHFQPFLQEALNLCGDLCRSRNVGFEAEIRKTDFVHSACALLEPSLFAGSKESFTHAILNPPYRKINHDSTWDIALKRIDASSTNLYSAFVELAARLLEPSGELVAILPRSFANGTYFRPFRSRFLRSMSLRSIYSFASRNEAFRGDSVLQENVIVHAVNSTMQSSAVRLILAENPHDDAPVIRRAPYEEVVCQNDPEQFIHFVPDHIGRAISTQIRSLPETLETLGLKVSTGPVVDFRCKAHLRQQGDEQCAPLLYPTHLINGETTWPREGKKPNAIVRNAHTEQWLVPNEIYVLTKRFTSKEERRRIVAAVHKPRVGSFPVLGIENHLNFLHRAYHGLEPSIAYGLCGFLNSTHVDAFFRQFSGHTQVNAGDLRKLPFPTQDKLEELGRRIGAGLPSQDVIDRTVEEVLFADMLQGETPIEAIQKIDQAQKILRALGLPKAQQNERSALTLLGLLNLRPSMPWNQAEAPLCGVHPLMAFFREHYGKDYAENSRETIRRQTIHQFIDAGMLLVNPDRPERPINSGKTVYQITPSLLELLRVFGNEDWDSSLRMYQQKVPTLIAKYAQERELKRIPIELPDGQTFTLSPGGQNPLVSKIIAEFLPQFVRQPRVLYVGDTDTKWAMVDEPALVRLGLSFDAHGKFPDVIAVDQERNWLLLFEAVTSHGPINPKRHGELKALFRHSSAPLVFVTTFLDRKSFVKYLPEIAWETEVWIANSPTHLIHFNGERFLGPYHTP